MADFRAHLHRRAAGRVLSGLFHHLSDVQAKLVNALALSVHFWFLIFPALVPGGLCSHGASGANRNAFLVAWIAIFFASALVIFFAGSARYLLPMAAPMALLAAALPRRWLASVSDFRWRSVCHGHDELPALECLRVTPQHRPGDGEPSRLGGRRMGPRHYLEDQGALPLH